LTVPEAVCQAHAERADQHFPTAARYLAHPRPCWIGVLRYFIAVERRIATVVFFHLEETPADILHFGLFNTSPKCRCQLFRSVLVESAEDISTLVFLMEFVGEQEIIQLVAVGPHLPAAGDAERRAKKRYQPQLRSRRSFYHDVC